MNLFEKGTRHKYRFASPSGLLDIEQLWDLPLDGKTPSIDSVYKTANRDLKSVDEDSIVRPTRTNRVLQNKLDIIKHIATVKMAERDKAKLAAANKAQAQRLTNILADAEDADMRKKSPDELRKMIAELEENASA